MTGEAVLAVVAVSVPVLLVYGFAIADIVRRRFPATKALAWCAAIVVAPGVGVLAYYAMRPISRPPGGDGETTGVADAVDDVRKRWEDGEVDDTDYLQAKRQLFRV